MARKLASREIPKYDSKVHGGFEGGGGPPGNYMLNPEATGVNLVFPSFNKGPLVMRPWPMLDYKQPTKLLQPGRLSPEPKSYSHWLVRVRAVVYTGAPDCDKVSFLLYEPGDEEGKNKNPYVLFYRACEQAKKSARFGNGKKWDSDWNKLFEGKKGEGEPFKEPGSVYFCQGHAWCCGEKDYMEASDRTKPYGLGEKDRLPVFQLGVSIGKAITDLFDKEKAEFDGDAEGDFSLPFEFGDPVGKYLAKKGVIKGGKILRIINPAVTKIKPAANNSYKGPPKEGEMKAKGYAVELLDEYEHGGETYTPRMDEEDTKKVFDRVQFWFDDKKAGEKGLLRFAPPEQQVEWIAKAFKSCARMVTWAFSDNEEFLTDEVKGILAARVSATVPKSGTDDDDDDQQEDEDDDDKPKGKVKKTDPTVAGKKKPKDDDEDEEDEDDKEEEGDDDEDDDKPAKKKSKKDDEEEDEDEDDEEEDEDDEEDEDEKPAKKKSKKDDDEDDEEEEDEDDEEEDEKPAKKKSKKSDDDEEEDDEDEKPAKKKTSKKSDDDDDEDDEKPAKKKGKKEDEDEDEDEDEKPAKKSDKKAKKPEKDEVDDLLDDDDNDSKTKKSLKAAEKAKDRSEKRKTPDKPAPKPPTSKGGTAKKK